jgi:hypothetical protein
MIELAVHPVSDGRIDGKPGVMDARRRRWRTINRRPRNQLHDVQMRKRAAPNSGDSICRSTSDCQCSRKVSHIRSAFPDLH